MGGTSSRSQLEQSSSMSSVSLTGSHHSSGYDRRKKKKKKKRMGDIGPRMSKRKISTSIGTLQGTQEEDDSDVSDLWRKKGKFYKRARFLMVLYRVYREQSQK